MHACESFRHKWEKKSWKEADICSFDDMHDLQVTPTSSKEQLQGHACNISLMIWRNTQWCSSGPGDEIKVDIRAVSKLQGRGERSGAWVAVWVGVTISPAKQTLLRHEQAAWKIHVFKYKISLAVCSAAGLVHRAPCCFGKAVRAHLTN